MWPFQNRELKSIQLTNCFGDPSKPHVSGKQEQFNIQNRVAIENGWPGQTFVHAFDILPCKHLPTIHLKILTKWCRQTTCTVKKTLLKCLQNVSTILGIVISIREFGNQLHVNAHNRLRFSKQNSPFFFRAVLWDSFNRTAFYQLHACVNRFWEKPGKPEKSRFEISDKMNYACSGQMKACRNTFVLSSGENVWKIPCLRATYCLV